MKQKITKKQLNELDQKGKNTLYHWFEKKDFDLVAYEDEDSFLYYPLPAIGQMIEFLDEQEELNNGWYIENGKRLTIDIFGKGELCDALWEAIKDILDKG